MTPILAFDIETIPDVDGLRRLWALGDDVSKYGQLEFISKHFPKGPDKNPEPIVGKKGPPDSAPEDDEDAPAPPKDDKKKEPEKKKDKDKPEKKEDF